MLEPKTTRICLVFTRDSLKIHFPILQLRIISYRLSAFYLNQHPCPSLLTSKLKLICIFSCFVFARQVETIQQYFPVFDKLRKEFFVGELIWNFADFMTKQRKIEFYLSMSVQCIYRVLTRVLSCIKPQYLHTNSQD